MTTNNFEQIKAMLIDWESGSVRNYPMPIKNTDSETFDTIVFTSVYPGIYKIDKDNTYFSKVSTGSTTTWLGGIWIGSDKTAPTEDDFRLGAPIDVSKVTLGAVSIDFDIQENKRVYIFQRTFTANESFNINEVCFYKQVKGMQGSNYKLAPVVLTRDVLPNTFSVSAGQTFTISIALTM